MTDERGIALPMALFALLLLSSLLLAFLMLGQSEPTIAANHFRVAQARALAESGVERAIWAMTNSTATGGIANNTLAVPGSPYDGSVFLNVSSQTGGFTLLVTNNTNSYVLREVLSVGYAPDLSGASRGKSTVRTEIAKLVPLALMAPCGLCVNGAMDLTGNMEALATNPGSCGNKFGAYSSSTVTPGGSANIQGTGTGTTNVAGTDYAQNQSFAFTLSREPAGASDIDTLRALAKTTGTYIKPASSSTVELSGVPNGIIFVDTIDGANTITSGNKANVNMGPGWSTVSPFSGWVIILGDLDIDGNFGGVNGILYTQGMVTSSGMGSNQIRGLTIVENRLGVASFTPGNSSFVFDCDAAMGLNNLPQGWFAKPGKYCDNPSGCP